MESVGIELDGVHLVRILLLEPLLNTILMAAMIM